ncbi:MAG: YitT family protein [Oscillospiraceae bacterium]|nr:YitT family protein [Oscillospiraceae bacterium]MBQ7130618.1 YitT family protein [Oscillospiraceae bacterium]
MASNGIHQNRLLSLLLVLLGNTTYALSVKLFLLPANLISCGTTGIALVVNQLTGIPLSGFIFAFNMVMLVLGWCILGKKFALTTVLSSLFYPLALEVLDRMLGDVHITNDLLLNTLFSGLGLGLSLGIVMRAGASTGGMDIPPLVLKKLFRIPVSVSLWGFDFCIMLAQMTYHTLEDLLYGIILLMVISFALNKVLLLGTSKTEVKIVSPEARAIRDAILSKVDRGVTMLHGEGGYLHTDTEVILSVVSNHEMPKIERLARDIDPDCFMVVTRVTEVWGRGFSHSKKYEKSLDN